MMDGPTPRRLCKRDLAQRIRRSSRTVDNWVSRGLIPPPRRDEAGRPFWFTADIEAHEVALNGGGS
jgi:hypothetical protein